MEKELIDKLIASYCSGTLGRQDAEALNRWVEQSDENRRYFRESTDRFEGSPSPKIQKAWERFAAENRHIFTDRQSKLPVARRRLAWFSGIAAAMFLAAVIAAPALFRTETTAPAALARQAQSATEYHTGRGERQDIVLPDGTKVCLNSEAKLTLADDFGGTTREIRFDGEAFFNVARDPEHPFIIHTPDTDYTVLGTTFNLQSYTKEHFAVVTLHTGRLQAKVKKDVIILDPNEELQIDSESNTIAKREVKVDDSIGWMSGRLVFSELPLKNVASKLSRYYQIKINVHEEISHLQYTGTVDNESFDEALNMIATTSPVKIRVTRIDGEYFLSRAR